MCFCPFSLGTLHILPCPQDSSLCAVAVVVVHMGIRLAVIPLRWPKSVQMEVGRRRALQMAVFCRCGVSSSVARFPATRISTAIGLLELSVLSYVWQLPELTTHGSLL